MSFIRACAVLGVFVSLAPAAMGAQTLPPLQAIAKQGDPVASARIKANGGFFVGALNDAGQVIFAAEAAGGGQMLVRADTTQLTPIVIPDAEPPAGQWGRQVFILGPLSMNDRGNAVFAAGFPVKNTVRVGTYQWDGQAKRLKPVALVGGPASGNLTFYQAGDAAPVINNNDEIAFPAYVKGPSGPVSYGIFLRGQDGKLKPVALSGQPLPGGGKVGAVSSPSLNDNGGISFLLQEQTAYLNTPYDWDQGALAALPTAGFTPPAGKIFLGFANIWNNDKNGNLLLLATLHTLVSHSYGLYLLVGGKITPVAVPGDAMPGGGKLQTVNFASVSTANNSGQHAFLATLEDGSTAAYLMDASGKPSLLLQSGTMTTLGKVDKIGVGTGGSLGIGLNNRGQVALAVQVVGLTDMVVLLTPGLP
jgi:hypothetical protein